MSQINFLEILSEKKKLVWREIENYLKIYKKMPGFCRVPAEYHQLLDFHYRIVSDYPERQGKYVRPSLVLLTAAAMGFKEEKAIKTAAAMQVSEDWILNHDDIEDDSFERRGKPALHKIYGKELAINAGDGLHILMWKILRDNEKIIGVQKTLEIIDEFYQMLNRTVLGQTVEIKWTQENKTDLTDDDVLFISQSKTGYYTIAGPMRLGAILAGADEKQLDKIYRFGILLGYCYQIQDDLLDLTSDFAGLKKQQGNDIYEGKRTIMLAHLLRNIKGKDKKILIEILVKKRSKKSLHEVNWVIGKMDDYGSLDYGRKLMKEFIVKAKLLFDRELVFFRDPAKSKLFGLVDFLENRQF